MSYRNMTNAQYKKQRYHDFAAAGLCARCGKCPPVDKRKFCEACVDHFNKIAGTVKHRLYQRQWRKTDAGRKSSTRATYKWRNKNSENYRRYRTTVARYCRNLRFEVMNHYGDRCVCCGEANKFFLSLDHIDNDGKADRLKASKGKYSCGGANFFRYIKRAGYPKNLQLLCFNCNHAKAFYGSCPHKG